MDKNQVIDIIKYLNIIYPRAFDENTLEDTVDVWYKVLYTFDEQDVKSNLQKLLQLDAYNFKPPTVYKIIEGLKPISNKVDFDKINYFCNICGRLLSQEEYDSHFNRCSSVQYMMEQSKKWFNRDLDKKMLYSMGEEEFRARYNKLLHFIYEHTSNAEEKIRIGYIFNPPNREEAKRFLNSGGTNIC